MRLLENANGLRGFDRGVDNDMSRRYSFPFGTKALFGSEHAEAPR